MKYIFIGIFIVVEVLVYGFLVREKNTKVQEYLSGKTTQYTREYDVLYTQYKQLAMALFETDLNTIEITKLFKDAHKADEKTKEIIRNKLFVKLTSIYEKLHKYNLKQLHFHLPNCDSFLRFHRPQLFGDNLATIRETVKYVNEKQEPIDGFEEGRIYNGYRFVFPLFYENTHIGSVEVSFSTLAMNQEFMNHYNVLSSFLITEDIAHQKLFEEEKKNYKKSSFEGFLIEEVLHQDIMKKRNFSGNFEVLPLTNRLLRENIKTGTSFSVYDAKQKGIYTFLMVQNPVSKIYAGCLVIVSNDNYITNKTNNFYLIFLLITSVMGLLLFIIYKILNDQKRLSILVEQKTVDLKNLNDALAQNKQELVALNEDLEKKIHDEVEKNRHKEQLLFEQSKLASMGEMIGNIAHQWRQPLSVISTIASTKKIDLEFGIARDVQEDLDGMCTIVRQTQFLSKTIDDFRDFIKDDNKFIEIDMRVLIQDTLSLVEASLKNNFIHLELDVSDSIKILGNKNQLQQALINIINNAKDAVLNNHDNYRWMKISTHIDQNRLVLNICDNGGGIDESIMSRIFEPYFTTKHQSIGTGLGLSMTYKILHEKHNAQIKVINRALNLNDKLYKGACFQVYFVEQTPLIE